VNDSGQVEEKNFFQMYYTIAEPFKEHVEYVIFYNSSEDEFFPEETLHMFFDRGNNFCYMFVDEVSSWLLLKPIVSGTGAGSGIFKYNVQLNAGLIRLNHSTDITKSRHTFIGGESNFLCLQALIVNMEEDDIILDSHTVMAVCLLLSVLCLAILLASFFITDEMKFLHGKSIACQAISLLVSFVGLALNHLSIGSIQTVECDVLGENFFLIKSRHKLFI